MRSVQDSRSNGNSEMLEFFRKPQTTQLKPQLPKKNPRGRDENRQQTDIRRPAEQ